jgi:hypothetical protein
MIVCEIDVREVVSANKTATKISHPTTSVAGSELSWALMPI